MPAFIRDILVRVIAGVITASILGWLFSTTSGSDVTFQILNMIFQMWQHSWIGAAVFVIIVISSLVTIIFGLAAIIVFYARKLLGAAGRAPPQ